MRLLSALWNHNQRNEALVAAGGLGINGAVATLIAAEPFSFIVCLGAGPGLIFIVAGVFAGSINYYIDHMPDEPPEDTHD